MHLSLQMIIFLCFFVFLAGFIDSVAGGGGLISLPAYMFVGLPSHNAFACNKFSSSVGTTIATIKFLKGKAVDLKVALISAIGSSISAYIASKTVMMIDEKIFKTIIIAILPIAAIIIFAKRNIGSENKSFEIPRKKIYIIAFIIGVLIGFYDGFVGPGTGTFAIIAYSVLTKYDLKTASGNAKILNLSSNYASIAAVFTSGKIIFPIAIPCAIAGIVGNYLGAGFAVKKGSKFIRPMMIVVILLLLAKIFMDVLAML